MNSHHSLPHRVRRTAALAAVLAIGACADSTTIPSEPETRVYAVVLADEQALPASRECPAHTPDVVTGTRFLEGDLTLFPEGAFRWRYTIEHYTSAQGQDQAWTEPVIVVGTYLIRGDILELHESRADSAPRIGRIHAAGVELTEAMPCPFPTPGEAVHEADLYLTARE